MARVGYAYEPVITGNHTAGTSTSTVDSKTLTVPTGANGVWLVAETNGCRVRFDGGTPDATHGLPLSIGAAYFFPLKCVQAITFVSQAAGNSVLHPLWVK